MENSKSSYKKRYKMNLVGDDGKTTTVAIPPEVIRRRAEDAGMTIDDFVKNFRAIAHYNGFDGVLYMFERIAE